MSLEYGLKLKQWRGNRLQKEAADILGVPLRTYQSWEHGKNEPAATCKRCVAKILELDNWSKSVSAGIRHD